MISVLTPTHRGRQGIAITSDCLHKQTFRDFEWLVCSAEYPEFGVWVRERPRGPDDFYSLNKCFNDLIEAATGDMVVMICDMTWFPSDLLQNISEVNRLDPKLCMRGIGNQYEKMGPSGIPEELCWTDPLPSGPLVEQIHPSLMEFRVAAFPKKMWQDVGGIDEEYDKVAALSEKEFCVRGAVCGYKFFVDRRLEYRFLKHEDHGVAWDKAYEKALVLYHDHMSKLKNGTRKPRLEAA